MPFNRLIPLSNSPNLTQDFFSLLKNKSEKVVEFFNKYLDEQIMDIHIFMKNNIKADLPCIKQEDVVLIKQVKSIMQDTLLGNDCSDLQKSTKDPHKQARTYHISTILAQSQNDQNATSGPDFNSIREIIFGK